MDASVLFGLPTESVAIRVIVASVVAVLLARLLLRAGLRTSRVRVLAALLPAFGLLLVAAMHWSSPQLPILMLASEAANGLTLRVGDGYVSLAPLAVPILVGVWGAVAAVLIGLRLRRQTRARRRALAAFTARTVGSARLRAMVARVAEEMRISAPPVAMTDGCAGGATVVGIRRPVILIDEDLAHQLDEEEFEGVIAHELAHIRRRDNLVATVLGVVRDLAFFVPGGRWALRQLHDERECAADELAVSVTRRPGALASGLLKVIEGAPATAGCAPLAPRGTVVQRVRHLVEDDEPPTWRAGLEVVLVLGAVLLSVAGAIVVPGALAAGGERAALAVLWHTEAPVAPSSASGAGSRAFEVYRDSEPSEPSAAPRAPLIDDDAVEVRPGTLRACAAGGVCADRDQRPGLPLQPPQPVEQAEDELVQRWQLEAHPVVQNDQGLSVYWLSRLG